MAASSSRLCHPHTPPSIADPDKLRKQKFPAEAFAEIPEHADSFSDEGGRVKAQPVWLLP